MSTVQRSIQMGKNEIAVQAKLQLDARNAELWSKQNKMYLSYDKRVSRKTLRN